MITTEDRLHVRPVVAVKLAWVCPGVTGTLAGTFALLTLLLESVTAAPPAGAAPVSVTVPTEEKPQVPLEGDMTSEESAGAVAPPGLIVNGALAEELLQAALAETVTNCCAVTALVEIVRDALLAPTGTVRGPEHAGVPVHPANVATWPLDGMPSLTLTDTGELASATRLRVTVAVSDPPPLTVAGVRVRDWIVSGGGVTTTFWVSGVAPAAPVVALTVAARLERKLLVAVRTPAVLFVVHPASMTKLPSLTKALAGLLVTVTFVPPTRAGADSVPWVKTLLPPGMVEMAVPAPSVRLNERSGGTTSVPPGLRVSDAGTETRLRPLPVPASV